MNLTLSRLLLCFAFCPIAVFAQGGSFAYGAVYGGLKKFSSPETPVISIVRDADGREPVTLNYGSGVYRFQYGPGGRRNVEQNQDETANLIYGGELLPLVEFLAGETRYRLPGEAYAGSGGNTLFAVKDRLGSVRGTLQNGALQSRFDYSVAGKPIEADDCADACGARTFVYRFQGHRYLPFGNEDPGYQPGVHDFVARLYDHNSRVFAAIDPAGQSFSPYISMGGDPVNNIDKDGRMFNNSEEQKDDFKQNVDGNTNNAGGTENAAYYPVVQNLNPRMEYISVPITHQELVGYGWFDEDASIDNTPWSDTDVQFLNTAYLSNRATIGAVHIKNNMWEQVQNESSLISVMENDPLPTLADIDDAENAVRNATGELAGNRLLRFQEEVIMVGIKNSFRDAARAYKKTQQDFASVRNERLNNPNQNPEEVNAALLKFTKASVNLGKWKLNEMEEAQRQYNAAKNNRAQLLQERTTLRNNLEQAVTREYKAKNTARHQRLARERYLAAHDDDEYMVDE